jgi:hypothetical protein
LHQRSVHSWLNGFTNSDEVFAALDAQFGPPQLVRDPAIDTRANSGANYSLISHPLRWMTSPLVFITQRLFG